MKTIPNKTTDRLRFGVAFLVSNRVLISREEVNHSMDLSGGKQIAKDQQFGERQHQQKISSNLIT